MESEHVTKQLRLLATDSLRACYVQEGVVASPTHFSDFWARDTFWALPGMLAVGDHRVAKKSIELFLFYQREDGKIPRKISRDINILKYLFGATFKRKHQRPVYTALVRPFYSMDDNALLVRAVWKYFEKTGDKQSLEKWYPQLLAAIQWYRPRVKELLVHEGILANWKDTVFTPGACLYTNVIYCEALRCFSEISGVVGEDGQQKRFARKNAVVEMRMQKIFWNGTFLEEKQSFDVAGNMLACWFDLVDEKKQRSIMVEFHKRSKKNIFFATQYPLHPWWRINPIALVLGMGDYHNGACWSWIMALVITMEQKCRQEDLAKERLQKFVETITKEKKVGETYFSNGKPYKRGFWKSAAPFAWSSGMFLEILQEKDT